MDLGVVGTILLLHSSRAPLLPYIVSARLDVEKDDLLENVLVVFITEGDPIPCIAHLATNCGPKILLETTLLQCFCWNGKVILPFVYVQEEGWLQFVRFTSSSPKTFEIRPFAGQWRR